MNMKLYGHRGLRGQYPENTLYGFEQSLDSNLEGIELDIVVNKDNKLIVSHEPWMRYKLCNTSVKINISKENEKSFNIYKMTQKEIQSFDCGSNIHPYFPNQIKTPCHKPLLKDCLKLFNNKTDKNIHLLFEFKSYSDWYGTFQPQPNIYAQLIVNFFKVHSCRHNYLIESFDYNLLNEIYLLNPQLNLGLLVENQYSINHNLSQLHFKPEYYNLEHSLINQGVMNQLTEMGIKCIPWTVNSIQEFKRLQALGIKSFISDYSTFKTEPSNLTTDFKKSPDIIDKITKAKKK